MHVGSSCAGRATMFRLQRRADAFTRIRDEGGEVPDVRSEHRPPTPFYPSCGLPRHRQQNVFKSLRYLRPAPKALRGHPRGSEKLGRTVALLVLLLVFALEPVLVLLAVGHGGPFE